MSGGLLRRSLLGGRQGRRGRHNHHRRGLAAGLLRCLTGPRRLARSSRRLSRGQRSRQPNRRDFVSYLSHQKLNRAITSIVRIEPALVTRPNDEEPSVAESPENAGVFVRF